MSGCEACRIDYPIKIDRIGDGTSPLDVCPRCDSGQFYVQKDFNRNLGLLLTILSAFVVYLIFGLTWKSLVGLLVIAAADAILHRILPQITICYRCKTIYRGFPIHPDHRAFDLHIGEHYRKS